MADLDTLIARLGALTEPSREVDALIWAALNGVRYKDHHQAYAPYDEFNPLTQVVFTIPPKRKELVTGSVTYPHAEPVTASIDSAVALVERVLPGCDWGRQDGFMFVSNGDDVYEECKRDHPAIALCIATLRALQAREVANG